MCSRSRGYAGRSFFGMMISLFVLLAQLDPALATSVRRSLTPHNNNAEPYGIVPPAYPYDPHPLSAPEAVVHSPRPILCNNHTEYECVCMRAYTSPHSSSSSTHSAPAAPDCSVFIKTDDLPVVDMRMRQVNTEAKLYTGDSYEEYFKRRISTIVSHYCQHNTNECPGVSLRMSHVSQDNVIILRMDHLRGNLTRLLFVLTKNDRNSGVVNEDEIIDPVKIKYIIASQVGPLSRVLGGIKIDSVRAAKLKRNYDVAAANSLSYSTPEQRVDNAKDNSKLVKILAVVILFFGTTYIIGLIQCVRWCHRRRKARKEAKLAETSHVATDAKNYGTCDGQARKPSRNGHMVHSEERTPLTMYEQIDENTHDDQSQSLSQRQMRNWFKCDSSQLPREPTYPTNLVDSYQMTLGAPITTPNPTDDLKAKEESPILTKRTDGKETNKAVSPVFSSQATTSSEAIFPPSKDFSDYVEDQFHKSRASSSSPTDIPKSPLDDPWDEMAGNKNVPPVVLLQSDTPDLPLAMQNHLGKQRYEEDEEVEGVKGLRSNSPVFARPRSRRGSRIDEPEGQLDILELKPLHTDDPLAEPLDVPVPIDSIKGSVDEEDRWSSSEEGEVDVYYKMSDDEDVTREELDWKKAMAKAELEKEAKNQGQTLPGAAGVIEPLQKKKTETPPSSPIQIHIQNHLNHNNDSDSEEDREHEDVPDNGKDAEIAEKDDDFVYERLREELSPQPPIVVDLDTTDLDLVPIKSLPPPPPGMFPDSPPESGSDNLHHQRSQEMSEEDDEDDLR
ncbi:unnamed protein product [Caenorhabditis sp. 36 PRJEB53466]|nr:unnamed protein product [Caenorhabditis sp. 36 PRJEB53466]